MLYKDEKREDRIVVKVKPSIKKLADKLWNKLYPWIETVDYEALFEQLITIESAKLLLIPQEDFPEEMQEQAYQILQKQQIPSKVQINSPQVITDIKTTDIVGDERIVADLLR